MLKKVLFLIIPVLAFMGGVFGGTFLRAPDAAPESTETASADEAVASTDQNMIWFKFPEQFFVPLMVNGQVSSTMIMTLTLEMPPAAEKQVFAKEHRLRDAMLRTLMIHANTGGFDGNFTTDAKMRKLRAALLAAAQSAAGQDISDILIEDIARHEMSG